MMQPENSNSPSPTVSITIPVAWGEMDALGHVNNVVFFRYFESARVEFLRQFGWREGTESSSSPTAASAPSVASPAAAPASAPPAPAPGFILQSVHARFRRPVMFPDTLTVTARCTCVGTDRLTIEHAIFSLAQSGALVAEGSGIVVCYDYATRQKAPLPASVHLLLTQAAAQSAAASTSVPPAASPSPRTTLPPS